MGTYRNTRTVSTDVILTSIDENIKVDVTGGAVQIMLPYITGDTRVNDVIKITHGAGDITTNNITIVDHSGDTANIIGGTITLSETDAVAFLELTDTGDWVDYFNGTGGGAFTGDTPYEYNTYASAIQPRLGSNSANDGIGFNFYSNIGGGSGNTIFNNGVLTGEFGDNVGNVIGGGVDNQLQGGSAAFIGAGKGNVISGGSYVSIVGGWNNSAKGLQYGSKYGNFYAGANTIGGGQENYIGSRISPNTAVTFNYVAGQSVIGGGKKNEIRTNTYWYGSSIGGGLENKIIAPLMDPNGSPYATYIGFAHIGGGKGNTIHTYNAFIGGGYNNIIAKSGWFGGNIGGGNGNAIGDVNLNLGYNSGQSVIGGGGYNQIGFTAATNPFGRFLFNANSYRATIAGGYNNQIDMWWTNSSAIGGGYNNKIIGVNQSLLPIFEGTTPKSSFNVIAGGYRNTIQSGTTNFIGGGARNIHGLTSFPSNFPDVGEGAGIKGSNVIAGGEQNGTVKPLITSANTQNNNFIEPENMAIGGGRGNVIGDTVRSLTRKSSYSTIGGGNTNRIEQTGASVIGGGHGNRIGENAISGLIGLSFTSAYNTIGGGKYNEIVLSNPTGLTVNNESYNTIGGGYDNYIDNESRSNIIAGGEKNRVETSTIHGGILAGYSNKITGTENVVVGGNRNYIGSVTPNTNRAFIGGGGANAVDSNRAAIVGGFQNVIRGGSIYGFIGGGQGNFILNEDGWSVIGGGFQNRIESTVPGSHWVNGIVTGGANKIYNSTYSFIGGGRLNEITGGTYSTISGGLNNDITNAARAFIGGGSSNAVNNIYGNIIGGNSNTVNHNNSTIIGSNLTSVSANTTHVERLNIGTVDSSTAVNILVREADGMVNTRTIDSITGSSVQYLDDLLDVNLADILPYTATTQADDGKMLFFEKDTEMWVTHDTVTHGTSVINGKTFSSTTINIGTPVYLVGYDSDLHTVEPANASTATTMPCIGLAAETMDNTNSKHIMTFGKLQGVDLTTGSTINPNNEVWAINDDLYVDTTDGGLTKVRPSGADTLIQRIAKVLKTGSTDGQLLIFNTARSAGLPNLTEDHVWIGNASNQPVETPISSFTQQKYAASIAFTAATSQTVTHNLNDTDVIVQLKDSTGTLIIPDVVDNYTANSVDIQVSSTETYRVIIIG